MSNSLTDAGAFPQSDCLPRPIYIPPGSAVSALVLGTELVAAFREDMVTSGPYAPHPARPMADEGRRF